MMFMRLLLVTCYKFARPVSLGLGRDSRERSPSVRLKNGSVYLSSERKSDVDRSC